MPIPLAIAAAGAALQAGVGIKQLIDAQKLKNIQQPLAKTPQALTDLYRGAKFRAGVYGMPGSAKTRAAMDRRSAEALQSIKRAGGSSAEIISGLTSIDRATKEQEQALGVQGAQFQAQQQQLLDQARREMAAEERRQEEANILAPFREKKLAQAALYEGGMRNLFDFAKNLSGIAEKYPTKTKIKPPPIMKSLPSEDYDDVGGSYT